MNVRYSDICWQLFLFCPRTNNMPTQCLWNFAWDFSLLVRIVFFFHILLALFCAFGTWRKAAATFFCHGRGFQRVWKDQEGQHKNFTAILRKFLCILPELSALMCEVLLIVINQLSCWQSSTFYVDLKTYFNANDAVFSHGCVKVRRLYFPGIILFLFWVLIEKKSNWLEAW